MENDFVSAPAVKVDHLGHLCTAPGLLVFDIEIQEDPEKTGGWEALDKMKIAVAVMYDAMEDRYKFFEEKDRAALINEIIAAQVVSGFNIWAFDLPLLYGVPRSTWMNEHMVIAPGLAEKVLDPHRHARLSHKRPIDGPCGPGLGLQDCAMRTLGHQGFGGKTAHGSEAPGMFQRGEFTRLASYCCDDVWLEHRLVRFARSHRYFVTGQGNAKLMFDPLWQ